MKKDWSFALQNKNLLQVVDEIWQAPEHMDIYNEIATYITHQYYVLEVGCATGVASSIFANRAKQYIGIDASMEALEIALKRNPLLKFYNVDVREITTDWWRKWRIGYTDIVICKAMLKHFSLDEWPNILSILASYADKLLIFSMNVADKPQDKALATSDYYDICVPESDVMHEINKNGFYMVNKFGPDEEPVFVCQKRGLIK